MKRHLTIAIATALLSLAGGAAAATDPATDEAAARADYQRMLEDAERARTEAEAARREAERVAEQAREVARLQLERDRERAERSAAEAERHAREQALRSEEIERAREELGRAHRELREASREVARAHRELARGAQERHILLPNLGDRAVIGVVLGPSGPDGIRLAGVSPGGPAEAAGVKAGDTLTAIAGLDLRKDPERAREQLLEIMEGAKAGDELELKLERDGQPLDVTVKAELREPSSWQSLIRIPEIAELSAPGLDRETQIIVERIQVPEIDQEALDERMRDLQERLQSRQFIFVDPEDGSYEWQGEFDIDDFSDLSGRAFADADIWFGLPQTRGLEFATVNAELGEYFATDRGVLVLRAEPDNAYGLRAGDVILAVGDESVDTPSELMRALRRAEPGEPLEIRIKRERRDRSLDVTMPENRLGLR